MKAFNEESFAELLTICNNNAGYNGVIILPNLSEVRQFMLEIAEIHKANPISGVKVIKNYPISRILFINNSLIDVIVTGARRCGLRYNELLCNTPFDPDVSDMVQGWKVEYLCEWNNEQVSDTMDNTTDTPELDCFLNSFVVKS